MRRQFGGKTFMVGRVHEYQIEKGGALLYERSGIRLDYDSLFPGVYGFEVFLDHYDAFFCFFDKGRLGGAPADGFYTEAAASCKEIQNHSVMEIVDQN